MSAYSGRFSVRPGAARYAAELLLQHVAADRTVRILDVGCGTGETLVELLCDRPLASGTGVDISPANIAAAAELARQRGCEVRSRWLAEDYLGCKLEPADLIFSESVMHLMPASTAAILGKLTCDLAPQGRLFLVMPDASARNQALLLLRRLLRAIRTPLLDRLLFVAARALYRDWATSVLRERVEYMYIVPFNLDGHAWRAEVERAGWRIVEELPWHQTSVAKLRHRLVIYERAA